MCVPKRDVIPNIIFSQVFGYQFELIYKLKHVLPGYFLPSWIRLHFIYTSSQKSYKLDDILITENRIKGEGTAFLLFI